MKRLLKWLLWPPVFDNAALNALVNTAGWLLIIGWGYNHFAG